MNFIFYNQEGVYGRGIHSIYLLIFLYNRNFYFGYEITM